MKKLKIIQPNTIANAQLTYIPVTANSINITQLTALQEIFTFIFFNQTITVITNNSITITCCMLASAEC